MKTRILTLTSFIFLAVLIITACKKDNPAQQNISGINDNALNQQNQTVTNELVTTSQNEAIAQMTFENIDQIADEAYTSFTSAGKSATANTNSLLSPCATKTIDTITIPHTLTIDFGTTNCLCNDGKYRRGQIVIAFYKHYKDSGAVHSTTFNNYYVNDNHIMGSRSRINNGHNAAGHWNITTTVNSMIIFALSGDTLSWNATHNREWLQGYWSPTIWDDITLLSGSSTGHRPNGTNYSKTIVTPLKRHMPCPYFVSGSVQLTQTNRPVRVINYGNGNCDPWATVTINGVTHIIHL
ncbi:MAG: hypothetical protein NTZ33_00230 [Bacteroidetes bacterium]|nr:hypothetical protein [Bacteroidota bacterium]